MTYTTDDHITIKLLKSKIGHSITKKRVSVKHTHNNVDKLYNYDNDNFDEDDDYYYLKNTSVKSNMNYYSVFYEYSDDLDDDSVDLELIGKCIVMGVDSATEVQGN